MRLIKSLIILFLISNICFGQENIEDENWLLKIGGDYINYDRIIYQFNDFTLEDVAKAKYKSILIQQVSPENQWEGVYYRNTGIGDSRMIWNSKHGFFRFYFYHYLRNLDYGSVYDSLDFIELSSEKKLNINKKNTSKNKLIKVKLGEKHFLVPENRLQDFCNLAAGLNTDTDLEDFFYYWAKDEDMRKDTFGLLILPAKYKQFLRFPIQAETIRIGKKIISNKVPNEYNFNDIHYPVTLNAGKNKNVKIKMNFFVEELGEWIQVAKVYQRSAVGFIKRNFDENKNEQCFSDTNGSGQLIPCKEIRIGMKVKTKTDL